MIGDKGCNAIFLRNGLESALRHLADRRDLDAIEAKAVQAIIEGLIPSPAQ